jgi:hypothetical protein
MAKENKEYPFKDFLPEETVDHLKAARVEFRKSFAGLVPPKFIEHRRAARKEMLLAMRSFLDNAIEQLESSSSN